MDQNNREGARLGETGTQRPKKKRRRWKTMTRAERTRRVAIIAVIVAAA